MIEDFFVSDKIEIKVPYKGGELTFFAKEIGFLAYQNIAMQANASDKNALAMVVAECIETADGKKFTYDEVLRLRREYAEPLFEAVAKLHTGDKEKN